MTSDLSPPPIDLAQLRARLLKADRSAMHQHMNIRTTDVGDGWATLEAEALPGFNNVFGRTHGGFAATLIDSALGTAVMTKLPEAASAGTVDLNVKYTRKIDSGTGLLKARADVVHSGRTMLTAEARITDAAGRVLAHGSGTFLVYQHPA